MVGVVLDASQASLTIADGTPRQLVDPGRSGC